MPSGASAVSSDAVGGRKSGGAYGDAAAASSSCAHDCAIRVRRVSRDADSGRIRGATELVPDAPSGGSSDASVEPCVGLVGECSRVTVDSSSSWAWTSVGGGALTRTKCGETDEVTAVAGAICDTSYG